MVSGPRVVFLRGCCAFCAHWVCFETIDQFCPFARYREVQLLQGLFEVLHRHLVKIRSRLAFFHIFVCRGLTTMVFNTSSHQVVEKTVGKQLLPVFAHGRQAFPPVSNDGALWEIIHGKKRHLSVTHCDARMVHFWEQMIFQPCQGALIINEMPPKVNQGSNSGHSSSPLSNQSWSNQLVLSSLCSSLGSIANVRDDVISGKVCIRG